MFILFFESLCHAQELPEMKIVLNVDLQQHFATGQATFSVKPGEIYELDVIGTEILSFTADEMETDINVKRNRLKVGPFAGQSAISIEFKKSAAIADKTRNSNFISEDGINLLSSWHPAFMSPAKYSLTVTLPSNLRAVSEAESVKTRKHGVMTEHSFIFPHPRENVTLVAANFESFSDRHQGIDLEGYFFREDADLAESYLTSLKEYVDRYEKILGKYPFRRFAVVENISPTGFGMPTYTLLGQQVIRLPFIVATSLGHEFVHSWFGNSVFVSKESGNWSEGLTTFFSDYLYQEEDGLGQEYRHNLLIDYQSYVGSENDMSLSDFLHRYDRTSKAIGYGKGAMFFHMLKRKIGYETFNRAIQRFVKEFKFRPASWGDLESLFSEESRMDLKPFFDQWLNRKDIPNILIGDAFIKGDSKGARKLVLKIVQENPEPYFIDKVPVIIRTTQGDEMRHLDISKKQESFEVPVKNSVTKVIIDPDFEIMRTLSDSEFPPALSRLLGSQKRFVINLDKDGKTYSNFLNNLVKEGYEKMENEDLKHNSLKKGAFIFLGRPKGMLSMLAPKGEPLEKGVRITVRPNPFNRQEVLCFVEASSFDQLDGIARKIVHYGKYSDLEFLDGVIRKKDTVPVKKGIRKDVEGEIAIVPSSSITSLGKIIKDISGRDIVYIGEQHDQFAHHQIQLRIIEELYKLNPEIAVGMEMFQYPFQEHIDAYMKGVISEKEFLKKTEYFKRWRFNYRHYRPVVEFCKKHGIKLLALNLPAEISKKVAKEGLESLTGKERRMLPDELDFNDMSYKNRLKDVYDQHKGKISSFNNFFQAQISWDETMAMKIAEELLENPGHRMVVLAGNGHVAYGSGIPDRVQRYGTFKRAILINSNGEAPEASKGDYFLFPPEKEGPFQAKLGILVDDDGEAPVVKEVTQGSPAAKSGLMAGDTILAFDGNKINSITDLRVELFFKGRGDSATLTVKRRMDSDDKTVELKIGSLVPFVMPAMVNPHKNGMTGP